MDTVARMPAADRAELFRNTADQMDLEGALVEKDFWVCWVLGHLFDMASVRDMLMLLVPPEARIPELRRDYDAMSVMMFGDPPPLKEILEELATLEARINRA